MLQEHAPEDWDVLNIACHNWRDPVAFARGDVFVPYDARMYSTTAFLVNLRSTTVTALGRQSGKLVMLDRCHVSEHVLYASSLVAYTTTMPLFLSQPQGKGGVEVGEEVYKEGYSGGIREALAALAAHNAGAMADWYALVSGMYETVGTGDRRWKGTTEEDLPDDVEMAGRLALSGGISDSGGGGGGEDGGGGRGGGSGSWIMAAAGMAAVGMMLYILTGSASKARQQSSSKSS
jgi:hypothetical protein